MSSSGGEGFALGEEVVGDPYPFFARLRHEQPLHRDDDGRIRVTRYADIVAALKDPRLSADDERWQQRDPFAERISTASTARRHARGAGGVLRRSAESAAAGAVQ